MTGARRSVVALAAAAGLLWSAPAANASPVSYIRSLIAHGVIVTDAREALKLGLAVCETLDTYSGEEVARALRALGGPNWSIEETRVVVIVAVEELCPWHDHRHLLLA